MSSVAKAPLLDFSQVPPHPGQLKVIQAMHTHKVVCHSPGRRWGKALALDTEIPTPDGWTTMGDIRVGDSVFSPSGSTIRVTAATPVMVGRDCYRITLSDGTKIVADADHLWTVETASSRKALCRASNPVSLPATVTTREMSDNLRARRKDGRKQRQFSIVTTKPIHYTRKQLPVDPYILGLWLGDGHSSSGGFTCADPQLLDEMRRRGFCVNSRGRKLAWHIRGLQTILRSMGVLGRKSIPAQYLLGDVEQRLELLRGLMDTDGTADRSRFEFCNKNLELAAQVETLIASLGIKTYRRQRMVRCSNGVLCGPFVDIRFKTHLDVFRLERKLKASKAVRSHPSNSRRYVESIEPVESVPVRCISVDADDGLFLVTRRFVATHNSTLRKYLALDMIGARAGWVEGCFAAQSHSEATNIWESDLYDFTKMGVVVDKQNDDQRRYIDFCRVNWIDPYGVTHKTNRGGRIWYPSLSADAHRMFQGHGLCFAILDECSHIPHDAWKETIRPMLADRGGPALLIGTPIPNGIGWGWFKKTWWLCSKTLPDGTPNPKHDPRYASFTGPSEENPHIDHKEVRAQRQELIDAGQAALAACLYDGAFMESDGAVFQNLHNVFVLPFTDQGNVWIGEPPVAGECYVVGLDYGKVEDFTVVSIFHIDSGHQVLLARLRGDYKDQLPTIEAMLRPYNQPMIYAEGREGAALVNELLRARHGTRLREVKWARGGKFDKESNVLRGVDLCQRVGWKLLAVDWQKDEFQMFMRERIGENSAGFRYQAAPGYHDDSVAAALYAAHGLPLVAEKVETAALPMTRESPGFYEWLQESQATPMLEAGFDLRSL